MASFTITSGGKTNLPPTQIGDKAISLANGASHIFTVPNFSTETTPQYVDPEGDSVSKVKVLTLSLVDSTLELNSVTVTVNQEIDAADITSGLLVLEDDGTNASGHVEGFTFTLSDSGSNQFSAETGSMTMKIAEVVNQPAVVGDGAATIGYGETLVFTRIMFTTQTNPPYSDPEGDAALLLKITALPPIDPNAKAGQVYGIKLNGTAIQVNDIINFSDIDLGLLTYVSDTTSFDSLNADFSFEIADAGSGIFTG